MTVGQLRSTMDSGEFLHWAIYYGRKAQRQQLESLRSGGGR